MKLVATRIVRPLRGARCEAPSSSNQERNKTSASGTPFCLSAMWQSRLFSGAAAHFVRFHPSYHQFPLHDLTPSSPTNSSINSAESARPSHLLSLHLNGDRKSPSREITDGRY